MNDPNLRFEVRDFFTIKRSWVGDIDQEPPPDTMQNHWPWLSWTPQAWGWDTDRYAPEQMSVAAAFHPQNPRGQSWQTSTLQPAVDENYCTTFTGQGLHAAEQWNRALTVDPEVIMVTQWNEWLAQRFIWSKGADSYGGRPIQDGDSWFVDVLSAEFNRDISPMKGGHTDNMYYQMLGNIRRFKGMKEPQVPSHPKIIAVDGHFAQWQNVYPLFWDPPGDTLHRNHSGYDKQITLTNDTGRNDIVESRVTHDSRYLYFYARTQSSLTDHSDTNWMLLFVDSDNNQSTGWQGYDYLLNRQVNNAQVTTVHKWTDGAWGFRADIDYRYAGNELELRLPRELVDQTLSDVHLSFKWADNVQDISNIEAFFVNGDVAPDRRFNYTYTNTGMPFHK